jgi:hypothetical protein
VPQACLHDSEIQLIYTTDQALRLVSPVMKTIEASFGVPTQTKASLSDMGGSPYIQKAN